MNVQSKFMSGFSLNGEVFCQGFDKSCTKFAVVVFDGFNGIVETGTEYFPGFNSLFSSATPPSEAMISDDTKQSDNNSTKENDDFSIYLAFLPLFVAIYFLLFPPSDEERRKRKRN